MPHHSTQNEAHMSLKVTLLKNGNTMETLAQQPGVIGADKAWEKAQSCFIPRCLRKVFYPTWKAAAWNGSQQSQTLCWEEENTSFPSKPGRMFLEADVFQSVKYWQSLPPLHKASGAFSPAQLFRLTSATNPSVSKICSCFDFQLVFEHSVEPAQPKAKAQACSYPPTLKMEGQEQAFPLGKHLPDALPLRKHTPVAQNEA